MKTNNNDVTDLGFTEMEKDLATHVDNKLRLRDHAEFAVVKGNKILVWIRRSYEYLDSASLKNLFSSLVRPHLKYGLPQHLLPPSPPLIRISVHAPANNSTQFETICNTLWFSGRTYIHFTFHTLNVVCEGSKIALTSHIHINDAMTKILHRCIVKYYGDCLGL